MLAVTANPKVKSSMTLKEIPIPKAGPNEVVVKLKAVSLNHRDLYLDNEWWYAADWDTNELVAGGDGAGTIVEVGEKVTDWKVNDEVMINPKLENENENDIGFLGGPNNGTFAEYVKISSHQLLKKPRYLSWTEAAAIPLALSTAWGIVVEQGKISKGETILIQGVGGGVATFVLQLSLLKGAKVIVTSGSDYKLQKALELGAIEGINYKTENVVERVKEFTNGLGVDAVIDGSGKNSITQSIQSLKSNGRLLWFGSGNGGPLTVEQKELLKTVNNVNPGMVTQKQLKEAIVFYEEHRLKPFVSKNIYGLEDYRLAYEELSKANQFGKIVILMD